MKSSLYRPSGPYLRADFGVLLLALCLLVYAVLRGLHTTTLNSAMANDRARSALRVPPSPPSDVAWQAAQAAEMVKYKAHLKDLLRSLSFPQQLVLPSLVGTEGYQFSPEHSDGDPGAGESKWWLAKKGTGHGLNWTDEVDYHLSAEVDATVAKGQTPSAALLQDQTMVRWDDRHVIQDRSAFNWVRIFHFNRFFTFSRGGMRILYSSWGEEGGALIPPNNKILY